MRVKIIKVDTQIPDLVERFQAVMAFIKRFVVGREAELHALKICLLTKNHLLLEGEPGLAKSRFAILSFRAFENARIYRNMFHGQTTTDEVVGPPNTKILRDQGIISYCTEGMLPTAHFAFLDELFNGPGGVLNSALNILNERLFTSAGKAVRCPLLTAVATANRVSDTDELKAFIDRFLILRKVQPADSDSARSKVIKAFLDAEDIEDIKFSDTLTLRELTLLQGAIRRVKIPAFMLSMLENVRTQYVTTSNSYISDRRYCWSYRALQAAILLACDGKFVETPPMDALTILADVLARRPTDVQSLETLIVTQFQAFERAATEEAELNELEGRLDKRIRAYDSSLPLAKKRALYARLNGVLNKFRALAPDQQYTIQTNIDRMADLIRKTEECTLQIERDLGLRDASGNLIDPDLADKILADQDGQ